MPTNKELHERFAEVFENNLWGDEQSLSGPGSRKDSRAVDLSIQALDYVVSSYGVKTISDIPCGDFNWFESFLNRHEGLEYCGFDIVDSLIRRNMEMHRGFVFRQLDVTMAVPPKADLLFSKEMLLHLTKGDIFLALSNMKRSKSKYLLLFNNFGAAYTELPDDGSGSCRAVDVCAAPFNFPAPIWRNEFCGLWLFRNLPDFCNPTWADRILKRPARLLGNETASDSGF